MRSDPDGAESAIRRQTVTGLAQVAPDEGFQDVREAPWLDCGVEMTGPRNDLDLAALDQSLELQARGQAVRELAEYRERRCTDARDRLVAQRALIRELLARRRRCKQALPPDRAALAHVAPPERWRRP